jgi:putative endonuclease
LQESGVLHRIQTFMFYVYILKSEINNAYYFGSSEDIDKRIVTHNKGLVRSTKRYVPWEVVHAEKFDSLREARARELQIKAWKKRSMIERLINKGP